MRQPDTVTVSYNFPTTRLVNMQVKDNMEVFKSLIKWRVYKIAAVQINNSHELRLCGKACVSLWDNTSSSVIHPGINVDAAGAVLVPPKSWAQCFQLYGG